MNEHIKTGGEIRKLLDAEVEKIPASNALNEMWVSIPWLKEQREKHTHGRFLDIIDTLLSQGEK